MAASGKCSAACIIFLKKSLSGRVSGFNNSENFVVVTLSARLLAAPNPIFFSLTINLADGKNSEIIAAESSLDALSTKIRWGTSASTF